MRSDQETAITVGRATAAAFRQLDDPWGLSAILYHLGWGLRQFGRYAEAVPVLEEAIEVSARGGIQNTELWALADQHHNGSVTLKARSSVWEADIHAFVCDWLRERFNGVPLKHQGKTVWLEGSGGLFAGAADDTAAVALGELAGEGGARS